ncbi:MAG TPA: helix-turn-helix domain-containing protein, partial [Chryseolinea sp.]
CWLGVFQSLLLGLYFVSNARHNKSNLFLGLSLILIGIRAAKSTLFIFGADVNEIVFNIGFAAHAAIGPALLLYVRTLRKDKSWTTISILHFTPSSLIVLFSLLLTLDNFWYKGGYGALLYYTVYYIGLYTVEFYYGYKDRLLKISGSVSWIIVLLGTVSVFQLAYFSNYILSITPYTVAPVFYSIALYFITFAVLKNKADINAETKAKYQNLRISDELLDDFKARILSTMETHRPYLDTNFTLQKLSALTAIPQHQLSHTFSTAFSQNFTSFINTYRIEESKRILCDPHKEYLSIAGIAYECGFNSLSSFNVSFKKNIGVTPSVFKKEVSKNVQSRP